MAAKSSGRSPRKSKSTDTMSQDVARTLKAGEISLVDDQGRRRYVHAKCSQCGTLSDVYKTEMRTKGSVDEIVRIDFRCPSCRSAFTVPAKQMVLY